LPREEPHFDLAAYHNLIAAVIKNAIAGLEGANPDPAMAFFLSETCEVYCAECRIDYARLRDRAAGIYRSFLD
jgi:hypothetical protein